jgi:hypothetical protein
MIRPFDVGVDGIVAVALVEIVGQGQQAGSLAGLARDMEQELFLLVDQSDQFIQVETR